MDNKAFIMVQGVPSGIMCEISRSFTFKLNVGNYENRDFYCAQKAECVLERAEAVSDALYQFCKAQVMKAVAEYKKDNGIK